VDVRQVAGAAAPWALAGGTSLAGMAATVLGRALDKGLQCSNWGSRHLTQVRWMENSVGRKHGHWAVRTCRISRSFMKVICLWYMQAQLQYAASDAWVGHQLLLELYHHSATEQQCSGSNNPGSGSRSAPAQPQDLASFVAPYVDARSRGRSGTTQALGQAASATGTGNGAAVRGASAGRSASPVVKPNLGALKTPRHACREKALYENARIQVEGPLSRL
jgi:hypothetical protein